MEIYALRAQGWTISAIARHVNADRKTVRAYLSGLRTPGVRVRSTPDGFEPFVEYCRLRLADDPHLWAVTLYDEIVDLGYLGGYSTFTRALRERALRPHCEPCAAARGRDHTIIDHPPGEETQWDWVELPDAPAGWGVGANAHLLVGALSHSGRWRGVLADVEDFAHLVEAIDAVVRRLGGLSRRWRFDRMATVCSPTSGRLTAAFAGVAKYYTVSMDMCPSQHGNRKGVVEKANHAAAQRWWRTLPDTVSVAQAQEAWTGGPRRWMDSLQRTTGSDRGGRRPRRRRVDNPCRISMSTNLPMAKALLLVLSPGGEPSTARSVAGNRAAAVPADPVSASPGAPAYRTPIPATSRAAAPPVGRELFVSEDTVETHARRLFASSAPETEHTPSRRPSEPASCHNSRKPGQTMGG